MENRLNWNICIASLHSPLSPPFPHVTRKGFRCFPEFDNQFLCIAYKENRHSVLEIHNCHQNPSSPVPCGFVFTQTIFIEFFCSVCSLQSLLWLWLLLFVLFFYRCLQSRSHFHLLPYFHSPYTVLSYMSNNIKNANKLDFIFEDSPFWFCLHSTFNSTNPLHVPSLVFFFFSPFYFFTKRSYWKLT